MNLREIIGINLKYYRYKSGLSQEKFYSNLGLSYKYLACVERGEENITTDYIDILARKLNINSEDLTTYNEEHLIAKKRIDEREKVGN